MAGGADDETRRRAGHTARALLALANRLEARMNVAPDDELLADDDSRLRIERRLEDAQELMTKGNKQSAQIDRYRSKVSWKVRELPALLEDTAMELSYIYGVDLDSPGRGGRASPLQAPTRSMISENLPGRSGDIGPV